MHDILVWRFKLFPADNSFFTMNNRITNHSMSSKKSSLRARWDLPKYWGIISSHEWEKLSSLQIVSKDEKLLKFAVIYVSWISCTSPLRVYVAIFFSFLFFISKSPNCYSPGGALKGSLGRGALRWRQKSFISLNPVYDKKPHLVILIHTVSAYRIEYTQFLKLRTWNL